MSVMMQTLKLAIQLIEKSDAQQRPIRTARFLIAVPIAILQIIGYQLSSQIATQRSVASDLTIFDFHTVVDDHIPLMPEFTWLYFLYLPSLIIPCLVKTSFRVFFQYVTAFVLSFLGAFLSFYFFPGKIEHLPLNCTGISCDALAFLRSIDAGNNLMPSLHAAQCMIAFLALFISRLKFRAIPLWLIWSPLYVGIVASTVFTKQHYFIDIPAGLIWGGACWYFARIIMKKMTNYDRDA
jgi:membrane-associated phospholipid phosphatase